MGKLWKPRKILVVDDEIPILEMVQNIFKDRYEVLVSNTGESVPALVERLQPDAMLLDIRMPKVDGYQVLADLKSSRRGIAIPVLILSALRDVSEKVKALRCGADDFITKPFHPEELSARIDSKIDRFAGLRRSGQAHESRLGNLSIDLNKKLVRINEREVDLTSIEFDILNKIFSRDGGLVKRSEIISDIWGNRNVNDRVLDAHIANIRKKLADSDYQIVTVYGGGLRLKESSDNAKRA